MIGMVRVNTKFPLVVFIFLVGGFELYVFNEMLHPNVNNHYRLYYIDKKLFSWSHGKGIQYDKSSKLNHKDVQRFLSKKGWSAAEKTYRWNNGKTANIYFKIKNIEQYQGLLSLNIATLGEQEIKVTINDKYIGSQKVNLQNGNIQFKFNPKIFNIDKRNTIKFEFPNAHKPNNADVRVLAMALMSFKVE